MRTGLIAIGCLVLVACGSEVAAEPEGSPEPALAEWEFNCDQVAAEEGRFALVARGTVPPAPHEYLVEVCDESTFVPTCVVTDQVRWDGNRLEVLCGFLTGTPGDFVKVRQEAPEEEPPLPPPLPPIF